MLYQFIKISSALVLAALIYFVGAQGCSPIKFADVGLLGCDEYEGESCKTQLVEFSCEERPDQAKCGGISPEEERPNWENEPSPPPQDFCRRELHLSLGQVDILFVIDNSSSMAQEHRSLASQFNSFLYDLKDVRYHIAVITTDISPPSPDPDEYHREYFQDGRFLPIGNRKFLKNENLGARPNKQVVEDFKKAIEREETKRCDSGTQPGNRRFYKRNEKCPSSDERGTYAVQLAIKNTAHHTFFRPEAHFMVVFLSDEDVRSGREYYNQTGYGHYQLRDEDKPKNLVGLMKSRFGRTKSYSFYSIIIPPGDQRCLEEQNRHRDDGPGSGRGYYGREYARLSKAGELREYGNILRGGIISICSRNYGYQLRRVAVSAQTSRVPLFCPNPDDIDLYVNGSKVRSEKEIEGRTLLIKPSSDVPLSSRMKVIELCPVEQGQACE